jgi:hypothetical protein
MTKLGVYSTRFALPNRFGRTESTQCTFSTQDSLSSSQIRGKVPRAYERWPAIGSGGLAGHTGGGWAFDVAYLVNSSLEPKDRRAWQAGLIDDYLASLQEHGGPAISFADAMLAHRQQSFWPYTAWAFTISCAAYQPKMQPVETCLAIVGRTATAIDDLDAFSAVVLRAPKGYGPRGFRTPPPCSVLPPT